MSSSFSRALPESVSVGRILRPHGLRGDVVVEVLSDVQGRFAEGSILLLTLGEQERRPVRVARSRLHPSGRILLLDGYHGRDAVEPLRGAYLEVERSRVPAAPPGSYYQYELLGCRCRDRSQGDLGTVEEMIDDGGGVLLRVSDEARELLVPFVEAFICSIDIDRGVIEFELPEGLVEICRSTS